MDLLGPGLSPVGTKLAPPAARQAEVARPVLVDRLSPDRGIALVVAPAGYGKTTLAAHWYSARPPGSAAWVSIDMLDERPIGFWAHLLAALRAIDAIDDEPSALLHERGAGDLVFVASMCNEVLTRDLPVWLVLDDLDRVTDASVLAGLTVLVERTDGRLRVLATGRSDPGLPLGRWRAAGLLSEARRDELRFEHGEAALFAASFRQGILSDDEIQSVNDRVEGWPAGLQLALLVADAAGSAGAAKQKLRGADRLIADYFVSEVLPSLTPRQRATALTMSVPQWFDLELCRAIAGDEAVPVVRELVTRDVFLSALDRPDCFRFHSLFRQLLEDELRWSDPALHEKLHRRCAAELVRRGDHFAAYRHLMAAGDLDAAVEIATSRAMGLIDEGKIGELVHELAMLPDAFQVGSVDQAIDLAAAHAVTSQRERSRFWIDRAAELLADGDTVRELRIAFLRAILELAHGDDEATARQLQQCDRLRAMVDDPWYFAARYLGIAARFAVLTGQPDVRDRLAVLHGDRGTTPMSEFLAPALESMYQLSTGHLREATALADASLERCERDGYAEHPATLDLLQAAGACALGAGRLERSAHLIERIRDSTIWTFPYMRVRAGATYVEVTRLVEGGPAALAVIDDMLARGEQPAPNGSLAKMLGVAKASALVACGRSGEALELLSTLGDDPGVRVVRGRALLSERSYDDVAALFTDRLELPAQYAIEADVLQALAATGGDADRLIRIALERGHTTGWVAPFLGHGRELDRLLDRLDLAELHPALAEVLRPVERPRPIGSDLTPLTERERTLLALLPTHFSNAQIGEQVHLSVNTIKTHLKALYRKLEVTSRAGAVDVARRAGLLPDAVGPS